MTEEIDCYSSVKRKISALQIPFSNNQQEERTLGRVQEISAETKLTTYLYHIVSKTALYDAEHTQGRTSGLTITQ